MANTTADAHFRAARSALCAPGVSSGLLMPDGERQGWADGLADVAAGMRMTEATPLRIGSITKTFTAAAVLVLAERGALDLDDPAVEHLPELRALPTGGHRLDAVTVRRLLLHRSGLVSEPPTRRWDDPSFPGIGEVLARIDLARVAIAPGSAFKYSNLGYALLGEIVARTSGAPYERFVQETLLIPAGMTSTTFDLPAESARGYVVGGDGNWVAQTIQELGAERAAGGLWSTIPDLLRWALVAQGGVSAVLSPTTAALLARPQTADDAVLTRARSLGWQLSRFGERVLHGHSGGAAGFTCHLTFDVLRGSAAVILANGHAHPIAACTTLLLAVERCARDSPLTSTPSSPDDPAGEYVGPLDMIGRIERHEDGVLRLSGGLLDEPAGARLDPQGADRFVVRAGRFAGEQLALERRSGGAITGFVVAGWRHVRRSSGATDLLGQQPLG
jgi:CubicO group peptidase (beta-lactamase class C family)